MTNRLLIDSKHVFSHVLFYQKELVRMLLFMQKEGKLSSDVPITDVMEWILCEGSGAFTLEFRQATGG